MLVLCVYSIDFKYTCSRSVWRGACTVCGRQVAELNCTALPEAWVVAGRLGLGRCRTFAGSFRGAASGPFGYSDRCRQRWRAS